MLPAPRLLHPRAAIAAVVLIGALAAGWTGLRTRPDDPGGRANAAAQLLTAPSQPHFRFFSPTSFWNRPLARHAPLAPGSRHMIAALQRQIAADTNAASGPTINTSAYSVPIYTVDASAPTVAVTLNSSSRAAGLRSAWTAVPLPAGSHPAAGTDGQLVVWQPSSGRLWEFWRLIDTPGGWQASWGGAIRDARSDRGAYGPRAWPGATRAWGASASSLSIAGGLITLQDLEQGRIDHALALATPAARAGVYAVPAQRTDGTDASPLALPEGAHLRLDPTLNLAALRLPPATRMIAQAAQRYGILVRDRAPHVTFFAQDPTPTATNPYLGPQGYFEGQSPRQLLASFPWKHLQVLAMALRRGAGGGRPK